MTYAEILKYIQWLSTPSGGMIPGDEISCRLAKQQRDGLLFQLAACVSSVPINATVGRSPVDTFFGHKTPRYSGFVVKKPSKRPVNE